jgi:hypothetical protein
MTTAFSMTTLASRTPRQSLFPGLLLVATLQAGALLLEWPATIDAVEGRLPLSASAASRAEIREMLGEGLALRCAMVSFQEAAVLSLFALLLHTLSRIFPSTRKPGYLRLLSLAAWTAAIPAAGDLLGAAAGWRSVGGLPLGAPGIAWLASLPQDLLPLLRTMNILTLCYIFALGAGLRVLFNTTARWSLIFAATAWALSVLANLWMLRMMRDFLSIAS